MSKETIESTLKKCEDFDKKYNGEESIFYAMKYIKEMKGMDSTIFVSIVNDPLLEGFLQKTQNDVVHFSR